MSRLVRSVEGVDPEAAAELLPLVYDELRALARARLSREPAAQTMQATALVHEAYMRLVGEEDPGWNGRRHFFGAASLAMRRILVEHARHRNRLKRGGGAVRLSLDEGAMLPTASADGDIGDVVRVDEAVRRLESRDPRKGQIVNLRYFAGLTAQQTADALDLSLTTVEREWRYIKAWLLEALRAEDDASGVP